MAQAPLPGTRWVARNGRHSGAEVEVEKVTDLSVFFKTLDYGEAGGNQKVDLSKTNRVSIEQFRKQYTNKAQLEPADTFGGRSFRKASIKKILPADDLPAIAPPLNMNGYIMTGESKLRVEILEISPLTAQAWLDRGGLNRKMSQRLVNRLAAAIRRGEWQLTGDSIKLDEHGVVRDGQHRLTAVVQAGVAITSLVVRNIGDNAFDVIDTGRTRLAGDVLSMHGFSNQYAMAAAIKGLMLIERFGRPNVSDREANLMISNASTLHYAQSHPEMVEAIRLSEALRRVGGFGGGIGLHAIWVAMALRLDAAAARNFIDQAISGAKLDADSPILLLRNKMIKVESRGTQSDREMILALAIKAWNFWRKGEGIKALYWLGDRKGNPEPFPEMV